MRGTITLLPLILTIYPLYYFFVWIDSLTEKLYHFIFPNMEYIHGSGIVIGVVAIFLLGLLMSASLIRRLYQVIEIPLTNIPIVKSLYMAIKELVQYLSPKDEQDKASKVVVVSVPEYDSEIVGFVTADDLANLPENIEKDKRVAVYIPMSYQVGGFTIFIDRSRLKEVDLPIEDAMKNVLTGWMPTE